VESKYRLDLNLSLTGTCLAPGAAIDPVPDPGCPGGAPPEGPHPPSGRFSEPRSVAIDPYGNEYVASFAGDGTAGRIDVFDPEGRFITELLDPFGPRSVAVDSAGNLYVFESVENTIARYQPSLYEPEAGEIAYGNPRVVVSANRPSFQEGLAVDRSNDRLYAAEDTAVREFGSAAEGNPLLSTIGSGAGLSWSAWVAVDSQRRRLYVSSCRNAHLDCGVLAFEADAPHDLLAEIDGSELPTGEFKSSKGWLSIAVDEESGHFFVDDLEASKNIHEFDENYKYVSTLASTNFQGGNALQIAISNGKDASGDAFNRHHLFVPVLLSAGRVLAFEPPGVLPPVVSEVEAANIGESEAELRATVNPEGGETEYVFEYVSEQAFAAGGFADALIGGSGTIAGGESATLVGANVAGLSPGSGYRFRLVAQNAEGEGEGEASFATYLDAQAAGQCPNGAARKGYSAALPDCRAYELVTPPDTNGRPPRGADGRGDVFPMLQSSPSGAAVSFRIEGGSLPGSSGTGTFAGDPYRATRGSTGWTSILAGPSGTETTVADIGSFSPDQGHSFWTARVEGPAVVDGGESRYVRYPDGHSELVGRGSLGTDPRATGMLITEGGAHVVFQTQSQAVVPQQLEPDAPPTGTRAVYDRTADEVTHVVSLLPGDVTPAAGKNADYLGASADGEGIAFEIGATLYLRKNNTTTYEIGTGVTFAGVSEGGERIFYREGGDLFAFDASSEETIAFSASGDITPVNVAPQGTRAYFASPSVLGGENPEGAVAQTGEQNLYLSEEGQVSFVGTVTDRDVKGQLDSQSSLVDGLGLWTIGLAKTTPTIDPSRLNPEGSVLLFQSRAGLDGQPTGGEPQVFRYDSAADSLSCLSCPPTGIVEQAGAGIQSYTVVVGDDPPLSPRDFVPGLTPDGKRAFFESSEALVSTDTDGVQDVYEWEEEGVGSCKEAGGCLYLISSGRSATDNYLYAHSTDGENVFFTTTDLLSGDDPSGTASIYDARINGGFAPNAPAGECLGEACQPVVSAPDDPSPTSASFRGQGNVKEPAKARRCPSGKRQVKRQGKARCVKKKQRQRKRANSKSRRTSK
jgi:hypothetical protein